MRAALSADSVASGNSRALDVSRSTRLAMVALGFIPLFHVLMSLAPVALASSGRADWRFAWLAPVVLFVAPPLAVRLVTIGRTLPTGRVAPDSGAFLLWWFSAQWQVVFARLPFLEELIRLVPGLYSVWLRLWGAQIGSLVYWSPGVAILDRPLIRVGSRVICGIGARLNSHVLAPGTDGSMTLHVGRISIGNDVLIGGYSLLLPGCEIADGEITPPFRSMHAFSRYEGGRRVSAADDSVTEAQV